MCVTFRFQKIVELRGLSTGDVNDSDPEGFDVPQVTLDESGGRADTYRSYIKPAENRRNLFVMKHAYVSKVLIDKNSSAFGKTKRRTV